MLNSKGSIHSAFPIGDKVRKKVCCEPTAEELKLLAEGSYTPEELWGGPRPTCPKCFNK